MKGGRGFTLVEVLVAILIGSLVMTSVYGIFTAVSGARNRLESEGAAYHQVRIFFDRIGGELRSLRLAASSRQPPLSTGTTLEGEPYLAFNTALVSPLPQQRGGLARVRYELRRDGELATLYRSEQVLLADLAAGEALPFVEGLKSFRLRYAAGGDWQEQWSGNSPPRQVEISLEVQVGEQLLPFRTSFVLPEVRG